MTSHPSPRAGERRLRRAVKASWRPWHTRVAASIAALLFSALVVGSVLEGSRWRQPTDTCSDGAVSRLYFGQATPNGPVSEADWRAFVADAVATRFPQGFTEFQAGGHWRDDRGVAIEEHTRIVEIAHADERALRERVRAIASDYRHRFVQESVLVTQLRATSCFDSEASARHGK